MDELKLLESTGFTLPSPAYIFGAILFGVIGFAAWRCGRKTEAATTKWLGVVLMFYPYFVSQTWLLYAAGATLCVGLYVSRP